MLMQTSLIYPKTALPTDFVQWKCNMLYGYTVAYLVYSMVYKLSAKFEPCIFWSQCCRILEWKPFNGIRGVKDGLTWDLSRFIQHKFGWFWTWWMVRYHCIFILYWWYIVLCCEKHSPILRSLYKDGHVKELKDQGFVRPRKIPELNDGWLIVDE